MPGKREFVTNHLVAAALLLTALAFPVVTRTAWATSGQADGNHGPFSQGSGSSGSKKAGRDNSPVLVTVNGTPITENQVRFYRLVHRIPDDGSPLDRPKLVERLIAKQIMGEVLRGCAGG